MSKERDPRKTAPRGDAAPAARPSLTVSAPKPRAPAPAAKKKPARAGAARTQARRPAASVLPPPLKRLLDRVDWAHVRERLGEYAKLARMHKPIGAALLLWPTWWALWLAAGDFPPWGALVIFTLGVFLMRSAGCVINDY